MLVACLLVTGLADRADAQGPEQGPLICGESSYVNGVFVATDYAYDDHGANTNGVPGGDDSYPEGLENSADLIQVQIRLETGDLHVRVILETLVDAALPLVGIAFDTDANASTGAAAIPGGAWAPVSPLSPLGVDRMVALSSAGTRVFEYGAGTWSETAVLPATIDPSTNAIDATIPQSLFTPGTSTWRAFGMAGLASDSWLEGGPIYDLAFLHAETVTEAQLLNNDALYSAVNGQSTMWQDHRQADVLAGTADPAEAAATIDFARVAAGDTELATGTEPGWHTFLFRSVLELGEGISPPSMVGPFLTHVYQGPYQPYLVHRKDPITAPHPLVVFLHGAGSLHTHNTHFWVEENGGFTYPGVTIFPLARGETLNYEGVSEFDVFEAMEDAMRRMPVDRDRVVLGGLSMGGSGTYRLASLYPDRFSMAIASAGGGSGATGMPEIHTPMENLVNLPFRAENGDADPLVPPTQTEPDRVYGLQLGYDFRFYDVHDGSHQVQTHLVDCLYRDGLARGRVVDPPRVRYVSEPHRIVSDPATRLELRYDSAYWVSGIAVRAGAARGIVDATSLARADRVTTATAIDQEEVAVGRDYCGENPDVVQPGTRVGSGAGSAWRERGVLHEPGPAQPVSNAIDLALDALDAVTLDLARMSLDPAPDLVLNVFGDGPTALELVGAWASGGLLLLKDGVAQGTRTPVGSSLLLDEDFTGDHVWVLTLDVDGDLVADADDNCPFVANPGQEDGGGIDTTTPDGIGDACQCGDVTGNGIVNGQDANAIKRHGLGLEPNPNFAVPGNCDVSGNGSCNGQDANAVKRTSLGAQPNPLFGQNCHNAIGAPVPQDL